MALTDAEVTTFCDKGFLVKRGLFSPDLMRRLDDETERLHEAMARNPPPDVHLSSEDGLEERRPPRIRQLTHSEKVSPTPAAMARSPEMMSIMAQLIGPDAFLFHSKLLMKAARDGTFTPWHQDWGYWRHHQREPSQINGMLAIDPA